MKQNRIGLFVAMAFFCRFLFSGELLYVERSDVRNLHSNSRAMVEQLLIDHLKQKKSPLKRSDLVFDEVKDSLIGEHYRFEHRVNRIPVVRSHILISIPRSRQNPFQIYDNLAPLVHGGDFKQSFHITEEQA